MTDRLRRPDYVNSVDVLDPRIKWHITMPREVYGAIPQVEPGDTTERFGLFLGKWTLQKDGSIQVALKAVIEDSDGRYVQGGRYEVHALPLNVLQQTWLKEIQTAVPTYKSLSIVGETHTHPDYNHEPGLSGEKIFPSRGDMEGWIALYRDGQLLRNQPYVTAISGKTSTGEDQINFYRLYNPSPGTYAYKFVDGIHVE